MPALDYTEYNFSRKADLKVPELKCHVRESFATSAHTENRVV
jgi:hypothetical protein